MKVLIILTIFISQQPLYSATTYAIGDLHGDYHAFSAFLRDIGYIDSNGNVDRNFEGDVQFLGDFTGRGDGEWFILDFFRQRFQTNSDNLHSALGNHEIDAFALAAKGKLPVDISPKTLNDFGGESEWINAFSPGGWVRLMMSRFTIFNIKQDILFVHGGLSRQISKLGRDGFAEQNVQWKKWTESRNQKIPGWIDIDRINNPLIFGAFILRKLLYIGKSSKPLKLFNLFIKEFDYIKIFDQDNPLWTRRLADGVLGLYGEIEICEEVADITTELGIKAIVIGHTPQENGIEIKCDERLYLIDTKISSFYHEEDNNEQKKIWYIKVQDGEVTTKFATRN